MGKRVDDARRILLDGASGVSSNTNQNTQPATRVSEANSILEKYTPSGFEQVEDDGYKYHKLDLYKPAERSAGEYQVDIDRLTVDRKKLRKDYNIAMTDISAKQRSGSASSEEINAARENANAIKTKIDDLDKQLEELKTGKWRAENSSKYGNITSNADFAEKSKIIDNSKGSSFGMTIGGQYFGFGDDTYAYINDINNRRERGQQMREGNMDPDAGLTKYSFMNQNEKDIYNYLYQTEGKKSAKEYLDYIEYDLDYRRSQQYVKDTAEYAEKHPILYSAQSVPQNLLGGIGLLDVAGQNAARGITGEYKPINYYGNAMNPTNFTTAVRGTVSQDLADEYGTINISEEDHPFWARVLNGKSLGDVYQLGMSMVDSGATAVIGSATGVGAFGTVMLGGSAGSQGVLTAIEKGATDDQALAMGILNGTFEALFEYVSMDKLLNGNTKGIIKTVLKQGFVEGTEELSTTLSNTIADICVMAENSDYRRSIQSYMDQGYSQKEAEVRAMQDIAIGMGWDFIGGAISGGIMGGGKAAINKYILEPYNYKKAYGQDIDALVSESLEISPDNKLAREIQAKFEDKGKVSGREIRRLVNQNEADILSQDKASITSAIEQRLTEYGETGYIPSITKAIAKQVFGEKLNSDEMRLIRNSKYGQRVANELNPENIRRGGYNTQWSEQLDTNRINPEEYSRLIQDAENEPENASEIAFNYKTSHNTTATENAPQKQEYGVSGTVAKKESVQETENTENEMTIEDASKKYGAQAGAFIHTYQEGQDVAKFDAAYQYAYEYGKSGVPIDTVKELDSISYLTEQQRELAYEAGKAAADTEANEKNEKVTGKANGKTGRRKGTVKGEGVTISDIKSKFNDQQGRAYRVLSTIAEATGIDIVLYQSEPNADGKFVAAQGAFKHKTPDKIYVDLNSGLLKATDVNDLAKYAMLRTFSHEFVHYVEYWNPVQYNEFRKVVFDELTKRGENVNDLIEERISTTGLSYEAASREVVAEAMTDILPDSKFTQNLAENHKSIFNKLLEKLKEFVSDIRAYFNTIGANRSREANVLKEQIGDTVKYVESIVDMFDTVAQNAVDNFQKAYAVDETSSETETTTVEETKVETKVETEVKTNVETNAETKFENAAEPKTTTSEYGFTISDNVEFGSIEISFVSKPSEAVRNVLKENKFRWNGKKKVWYGKTSRETITDALDQVYEAEKQPKESVEYVNNAAKQPQKILFAKKSEWKSADVEWHVPNYKKPIAYSTRAASDLIETLAENNPKATISEIRNMINYDVEAKKVLDSYISNGFGNQIASDWFVHDKSKMNEEEKKNVIEDENQQIGLSQSEPDGEGTSRLLDELQAEDVQGTGGQWESSGSDYEGGRQAERDGDRTDTADRTGGSEGSGKSGDLRRDGRGYGGRPGRNDGAGQDAESNVGVLRPDDGRTERAGESGTEEEGRRGIRNVEEIGGERENEVKLHEVVIDLTEQKSKETPKGKNFVIGESLNLPSGEKSRFRANIDAIKIIKQLETEGRYATRAEQEVLSKYVGWGGLSNAFGELSYNRETRKHEMVPKSGWEKEFAEFRQLVTDGIITEDEYKAMSASTKNAHYTSIEVIKAMYDGLSQLGFKGGRMLEPSSGVGNFVGGMPASMSKTVNSWTMVELDQITGKIAKYLYPNADVRIQGFETANIPDNYMDVAIGNVPFGNYGVVDRSYPKRITKSIHNYFFAKSLDKVRNGGIVMFITSSFTMNGQDNTLRQYIMDRADLLGAIRLPNTAFSGNAGTEVVTDILILKKRAKGTEYAGEPFLNSTYRSFDGSGAYINEYFDRHPEMVLGKAMFARGMYGANSLTYSPLTEKGPLGDQIREAFKNITGKMDYNTRPTAEKSNFAVEKANKKTKNNGLEVKGDGKVYRNDNGKLVEVSSDKATVERVSGLLGIRDAYRTLVNYLQQGQDDKFIKKARNDLNKAYDEFVKKYGLINSPKNKSAIAEDPDSYSLLSLENYDAKKKTATKADIFTKNTISANRTITHVDDVASGVIVSINTTGGLDASLIAKLTGRTEESVTRELIDSRMAFKTRDGSLETPETYLSGNVRAKLREAEALAPIDKDFQNNVEELRKVIPKDIPFNDIYAAVGTPWIPNNVYADFIAEMLGGQNIESSYRGPDVTVGRTNTGDFKIVVNNARLKSQYQNTQKWGTKRRTFLNLMEAMMSNGSLTVNDYIEDENGRKKAVVNKVETAAAQAKAEEISKEFSEWLWKDENRRKELSYLYNETFNALVPPKYNGNNLRVNGLNPEFQLRPHQANAVQRIISSGGNTLLAHKVGAGKTLEMAAAAMKLRELGVVKKPVFVVPKNLVAQWGVEFKSYFPAAKLLVADEKSFTKANRKTFSNRIANGDYDAVILSYEQFEKIPMSAEYKKEFYQNQIDEIMDAIAEEKAESRNGKGITVKEMEKKKAQLEKKIAELTTKAKDDDNIDFEQLGIDSLFVDEAHKFKNLQYVTRMRNVSGLGNTDGSQRAFDLYTKVRYLQGLNGGRGIVFATATPVMNSMSEMYIMQKYLQSDMLEQLGLKTFDAWAKQFGEVVNSVEIKPSGQGFRVKQTFSNFRNLNELQLLFRSFSDVLTDVPGLKIPKMKGGKVQTVVCEPGQFQKDYMAELEKRADNVKNVDPKVDNMLKITSDGRKVSYTQRMIDPTLPYEPGCKIYRCCDNVLAEYKDSSDIKGTQIIFCDLATPKGSKKTTSNEEADSADAEFDTESAKLYDDMKAYLVKRGIPANEIAFIHDANSDAKKKQLFADVNDGLVRVLIGSTEKMGVGMNAQKRIVAIHHLDAPWRPGDVEQRDGRAFRQKNMNEEVTKYTYVTEGSFDARLWDILDRKQHFINQIMNGDDVGRSAEDTGDVTLSAAEVKALASGNPMIMEQVQLSNDISKLQDLKRAYNSSITAAKAKLLDDEQRIGTLEKSIVECKADIKERVDTYSEGKFSMKIGNKTFTEKKDAGVALASSIISKAKEGEFVTIGKFAGFDLRAVKKGAGEYSGLVSGNHTYKFNVYPENTTYMVNHIIGVVEGLENRLNEWTERLSDVRNDRDAQERMIAEPFSKQEELDQKMARYNEVMAILNPKEEQVIGDDGVQEQSRTFIEDDDTEIQYSIREEAPPKKTLIGYKVFFVKNGKLYPPMVPNPNAEDTPVGVWLNADIGERAPDSKTGRMQVKAGGKGTQGGSGSLAFRPGWHLGEVPIAKQFDRLNPETGVKELFPANFVWAECEIAADVDYQEEAMSYGYTASGKFRHSLAGLPRLPENGYYKYRTNPRPDTVPWLITGAMKVNRVLSDADVAQILREHGIEAPKRQGGEKTLSDLGLERFEGVQYQQRTSPLTDREVLSMAASEISVDGLNDFEIDALRIFRQRLENLNALEEKRREEGRLYKEQQFGANSDRAEAEKTLNRMKILDRQIARASNEVLDVEKKEVLKRVLQKSRKIIEKNEREHGKELLNRYRDRQRNAATIKKYKERIKADTDSLTKWILHPKNKDAYHRVPDALKNTIIPFLTSIDFTSKRQLNGGAATKADEEFMKQIKNLRDSIRQNMDIQGIYSGYNDLPPGFMDDLQRFIDSAEAITKNNQGQFVINRMTSDELKTLSKIVRVVKSLIVQMNSFHQNAMFQHTYDAGDNSIRYMGKMDNAKNTGAVSDFLLWQQIRPAYAFERFGDGGVAIYDEFRRAQATLAFNTKKIIEFTEETYTKEEINAWEKEEKTFVLGGDTVTIPVSRLMGLYELSKRPQALGHLLGAGMRVATYKNGRKKIADVGHELTPGDISKMINALTPRQKEVADKLQQFMAKQGAEWGNYVSVARFGEEMFGEEHYYPINSDGRHLQSTADEHPDGASLYALLNMSFTKELQEGANNRIILYSIFDVFANHMASMAQYNAFALPILDSLKWFNYQQIEKHEDGSKTVLGSVREQMARVYGTPEETRPGKGRSGYAETFVMNIIKAFNGTETQGIPTDETGMKLLHRYNMAQVAYNFRVVVQQPMAITRAGLLIDYSSIIKGLKLSPKEIKANIKEMQKYSGIAAWKDLGFYDINISRGLTEMIKHNETKLDKVNEIGMWGAEKADLITWAAMWSACKEQIIKGKNIPVGSDDFYDAVTKLFEDVIYKTQVVDSVLTKNEFLRSKGVWTRIIGSFMSEPTTTASMLIDAFEKYVRDLKTGMNRQQAWKKNGKYIVRVAYVYAIGSLLISAVTGVADALRDDDDYQTFLEKWLEAFGGNLADELNPMNKLPIMRDFYELVKSFLGAWGFDTYGNEPRSVIFQWRDYLLKSSKIFHDKINGVDTDYTWYGGVFKMLQAISGMTGLPMGSATRELTIAWNNTVGAMAPSLKAKTYDPGTKNSIKYAYQDGYLTEEEAISKLIETGEAEDENDAYWIVNSFDGYGKYDSLKLAIQEDDMDAFDDAMDELTTHGVDEKTALSKAKSTIKELYTGSDAVRMLAKYTGMNSEDIRGFYDSGVIRYSEAVSYLKKYVGKSDDDATATVERWKFIAGTEKYKDITTSAVSNYNEYCASAGISKDMYFNAWSTIKDFTGEDLDGDGKSDPYTKADKIISYIGSLSLSRDQKTSLALAFGISRTTIAKRAPW